MSCSAPAVPDMSEPWQLFINKAELLAGMEQANVVEAQVNQALTWFEDVAQWDAPADAAECTVVDLGCFTMSGDPAVDAILRRAMLALCTVPQLVMEAHFTEMQHISVQAHGALKVLQRIPPEGGLVQQRQWGGGSEC